MKVLKLMLENNLNTKVSVMAIEDKFVEQGSVEELRDRLGISDKKIYEKVRVY